MKEFKTNIELIEILKSKGIESPDINKIKRYSYFNIISTYKFPFKNGDFYLDGVTFDEIYSLYLFDKNLRIIFLKYLLDIEECLKVSLSYLLMSNYGIKDYLNKENFDENINDEIIDAFLNKVDHEINKQIEKHNAFIHYNFNYGFIPPYVLMKGLSFGEISILFSILKQKDRQEISKKYKLNDNVLKQMLINFTIVRNLCAHNDRLFTYSSRNKIIIKNIDSLNKNCYPNLNIIKESMKLILTYENSIRFEKEINNQIYILRNNIKSIDVNRILNRTGFVEKQNQFIRDIKEFINNYQEISC